MKGTGKGSNKEVEATFEIQKLTDDLTEHFKAKVKIQKTANGSGKMTIPFKSEEDLGRILNILEL